MPPTELEVVPLTVEEVVVPELLVVVPELLVVVPLTVEEVVVPELLVVVPELLVGPLVVVPFTVVVVAPLVDVAPLVVVAPDVVVAFFVVVVVPPVGVAEASCATLTPATTTVAMITSQPAVRLRTFFTCLAIDAYLPSATTYRLRPTYHDKQGNHLLSPLGQ